MYILRENMDFAALPVTILATAPYFTIGTLSFWLNRCPSISYKNKGRKSTSLHVRNLFPTALLPLSPSFVPNFNAITGGTTSCELLFPCWHTDSLSGPNGRTSSHRLGAPRHGTATTPCRHNREKGGRPLLPEVVFRDNAFCTFCTFWVR